MPEIPSPMRYPGGKSRAVKIIRPYIRSGSELFSPFFGGGSVEFDAARRGARVYGYDTYGPLVCFYQQLKNNRDALLKAALDLHPLSDDRFHEIQASVHLMRDGPQKAASIFALNQTTHMSLMQSGGPYRSQDTFKPSSIHAKLAFDMRDVTVDHLDFRESFKKHPDTFAFVDPPYLLNSARKEKLYGTNGSHHREFNHDDLFEILKDRKNWIMTHQDHPEIRERYVGFEMDEKEWHYTMSKTVGRELIIKSKDHKQSGTTSYFGHGIEQKTSNTVKSPKSLGKWLNLLNSNPVALAMKKAELDIENVVSGRSNIAILSGVPGIGKSHLLHNCSDRMKERNINTMFVQFTHPRDLDDAVLKARGTSLIVADEADGVLRSKAQIGRLKLLADPTFKKPLTIGAGKNAKTLQLTCPIILAFNADTHVACPLIQTQLDALYSRKRPVKIEGNKQELWEYSVMIALTTNLLKNFRIGGQLAGGSLASFAKAIDLFSMNIWNLTEVSPRSLQKIYQLVCEQKVGVLTSEHFNVELHSLMEIGPGQQANLPTLEDWAALRTSYISAQNAKKSAAKTNEHLLPEPLETSQLAA